MRDFDLQRKPFKGQPHLRLVEFAREPPIRAYLLWLFDALEQAEAQTGLFVVRSIEQWRQAIWPLVQFARDSLQMAPSDSFRWGYNPPDDLRREWDTEAEGKKKHYPIPSAPIQTFLFDCMRLIDTDRARTITLRSLLSEWVVDPGLGRKSLPRRNPGANVATTRNRRSNKFALSFRTASLRSPYGLSRNERDRFRDERPPSFDKRRDGSGALHKGTPVPTYEAGRIPSQRQDRQAPRVLA